VAGCFIVILFIIGIVIAIAVTNGNARERARAAYQSSLTHLKQDPANPDLREETLRLGRAYASLMRSRGGVALFDEVALSNDINAACAAAARPQRELPPPAAPVEERLARLAELREKGLIDEHEYTARRQEILRDI
jgi:hypothetical protein